MGCSGGSSTKSQSTLSKEQREALEAVNKYVIPKIGQGATPYGGELVAPASSYAIEARDRFQQNQGTGYDFTRPILEDIASGESFYDYDPEGVTSEWEQNFAKPMMRVWNDVLKPQIEESYNLPGAFHSTRKSQGVARAGNEFYGQNVAPRLFDAQQAERARAFAAQTQAKSLQLPASQLLEGQESREFGQTLAVEDYFRGIEQQGLTASYKEFLRTAPENDPWTQLAMGYMTQPTMDTVVTTDPDRIGQLIGAAGTIGGGMAAKCDVRMKENIVPLEDCVDKLNALRSYTFNYVNGSPRRAGIMAQDLESVLPEAVVDIDGVKHIDLMGVVGLLVNAINELSSKMEN